MELSKERPALAWSDLAEMWRGLLRHARDVD